MRAGPHRTLYAERRRLKPSHIFGACDGTFDGVSSPLTAVCKICVDANQHFKNGFCVACPSAASSILVAVGILLAVLLVASSLYALHETQDPKFERCSLPLRRWVFHAKAFSRSIGLLCKFKVRRQKYGFRLKRHVCQAITSPRNLRTQVALTGVQVIATLDSTYSIGLSDFWFRWVLLLGSKHRRLHVQPFNHGFHPCAADGHAPGRWGP